MTAPRVLVVIPAHDEAGRIAGCLRSVIVAARAFGGRVHVIVVAHRCTDATVAVVRQVLAGTTTDLLSTQVVELPDELMVGAVRTAGVRSALAALRWTPGPADWMFSTDADTVVPGDWLSDGLGHAERAGADLVLGLVDLWEVDDVVRTRHDQLVAAGVAEDGTHSHAYAANLLVRLEPLLTLGGFPPVAHGEERALATAMRNVGHRVLASAGWRVLTSGRTTGRAPHGLHVVLGQLSANHWPALTTDSTPEDAVPAEQGR